MGERQTTHSTRTDRLYRSIQIMFFLFCLFFCPFVSSAVYMYLCDLSQIKAATCSCSIRAQLPNNW